MAAYRRLYDSHRGKGGPALGGTEYRLMPSACRLIYSASEIVKFTISIPRESCTNAGWVQFFSLAVVGLGWVTQNGPIDNPAPTVTVHVATVSRRCKQDHFCTTKTKTASCKTKTDSTSLRVQ